MNIDQQTLISRLTQEFGYPLKNAALVAEKLRRCSPLVAAAFEQWWYTGVIPELSVEEYSVTQLINERKLKPIAAFLTLDWLVREPEKAKASLRKGHDFVKINR
ncbi:MAG: hypothetical protein JXA33_26020 [Anaerolineae bacterium]|nr:hypothetical protein [Anaerolineae bacterium]